jgi:CBS domain-containing protein
LVDSQAGKKLIGIVTDRDFVMKVIAEGRDPKGTRVGDVMTSNPVTCREDDDVQDAAELMAERQVRRIPVVDEDGTILGIIAQADLATRLSKSRKTGDVVEKISK